MHNNLPAITKARRYLIITVIAGQHFRPHINNKKFGVQLMQEGEDVFLNFPFFYILPLSDKRPVTADPQERRGLCDEGAGLRWFLVYFDSVKIHIELREQDMAVPWGVYICVCMCVCVSPAPKLEKKRPSRRDLCVLTLD